MTENEKRFADIIRMNPDKKRLITSMLIKRLMKAGLLTTGAEFERKLKGRKNENRDTCGFES